MTAKATDFAKGQRVRYIGALPHGDRYGLIGMTATVIRPVKSRDVVTVEFDAPPPGVTWSRYDARPDNLEHAG